MRTATGLALIAIGAILAFAVTTSPSFLNLQVVGWILILTGVAGLVVPRRGYGWLRRRVVVRRPRGGAVDPDRRPRRFAADPDRQPRRFRDTRWFRQNAIPDPRLESTDGSMVESAVPEGGIPDTLPPAERAVPGGAGPHEETVEEYFEE
jgi:Domain of unknown function (DUF6458)